MLLLALAALDLNGECGSFNSDPVTITHPLCKPSVRDVYDVYDSNARPNQHSAGLLDYHDGGWSDCDTSAASLTPILASRS